VLVWGFVGWEAVTLIGGPTSGARPRRPPGHAIALVVVGVLYLAVATTSLLTLGPATATTEAPLAELLAIGFGGQVRVITAAVPAAHLGAMNAYFAGGAKLRRGARRDAPCPPWLARGSRRARCPAVALP